jgi:uncharacterized membrane protein
MNHNRRILIVVLVLALIGLLTATYVFTAHALGYALFCPFGGTGCDAVQNSPYAQVFGIPDSLLGVFGYLAYIVLAFLGLRSGPGTRGILYALLVLSLVDVIFTAYLAYLMLGVIRAVCTWCAFSGVITVILFFIIVYLVMRKDKARA